MVDTWPTPRKQPCARPSTSHRPPGPLADLPTEELVAAARGRRVAGAWAEIVVRYERLVLGVVGSFRLQEADAADAAASTWLRAMEGLPALRDPERLGGWLRTIARRECLGGAAPDRVRGAQRHRRGRDARRRARARGGRRRLRGGPRHHRRDDAPLRTRQQLILALFFLPRASYTTVAADAEMPIGSIGPTRKRALGALRVGLEQAGYGPDALAA